MKDSLAAQAKMIGFDLCGITACDAPPHARQFEEWLADGRAGEMTWLERNRERRVNPQLVLPGARSLIVLGINYWQGENPEPENSNIPERGGNFSSPQIARYAHGDDYHELIEKKLKLLDAFLTTHGGIQKCYVDTGPVLERDFAAKAGIGWHGKSTMLINESLGTWFFLAEILTTLEIAHDEPQPDRCGSCTRCIDACPTRAITAPYQLDARRCISYLTIELKGSIPVELRTFIGARIYGCDDCLSACPWNRFAKRSNESAFAMRDEIAEFSLVDYLGLTDEQFRILFRKSPIKRIKRRGFLRNVCVALGNTGTENEIPSLQKAALDPEPLIREHAQWAIQNIRQRRNEEVMTHA